MSRRRRPSSALLLPQRMPFPSCPRPRRLPLQGLHGLSCPQARRQGCLERQDQGFGLGDWVVIRCIGYWVGGLSSDLFFNNKLGFRCFDLFSQSRLGFFFEHTEY